MANGITAKQIRELSDEKLLEIVNLSFKSQDDLEKQAGEYIKITQKNKTLEGEKAQLEAEKAQLKVENGRLNDELKKKQPPISEFKDDQEIENLRTAKQKAEARAIQADTEKQQAEADKQQAEARANQADTEKQQALTRANQAEANNQNQWQIPLASGLAGFALGGFLGYNLKPKKKKHRDIPDINSELI